MKQKHAMWVLETVNGDWLFHGNMNRTLPPYHVNSFDAMARGLRPVCEHTRGGIEITGAQTLWNNHVRNSGGTEWYVKGYLVSPRHVMLEVHDYANKPPQKRQRRKDLTP